MRATLLVGAGVAASLALVGGSIAVAAGVQLAPPADSAAARLSQRSVAWTAADRLDSRRLVPLEIDAELGALEVYSVTRDATLHPMPYGMRREIWSLLTRIMTPEETVRTIAAFKIGDDPESTRTAWVSEHGSGSGRWTVGVNLARSIDPTQVAATLIHEYAHIISLRDGQVVPAGEQCTTVLLPEGCALPGGYLDAFHNAFWTDYGLDATGPANANIAGAVHLLRMFPDAFVSEYAAMNVAEDFAESFAAYVHVGPTAPADAVGGKLAFFDRYEEMVQIRERIRAALDGTLGTLRIE